MINQQSGHNKINSQQQQQQQQLQQQQQFYYTNYPQTSFIQNLFSSSVQPKITNLFEQPGNQAVFSQKAVQQIDFNDSWDDLAYQKYQNTTNIEQNDTQFFTIFAPSYQQNQSGNVPHHQQQQMQPIFPCSYENPQKRFQSISKPYHQNTSPYTPQKQSLHLQEQKSNKKWMSGSIHSTPQTAPCSTMKEENFYSKNNSSCLHNNNVNNNPDITEFSYNVCEQHTKKSQRQSKINCCFSASCSNKSSNYNSDSEESCFLSTNTHFSSTSQSHQNKPQTRKIHLKNSIDEIWNRPYDGTLTNTHFTAQ